MSKQIQREDIHLLNQHSNLTAKGAEQALKTYVYTDKVQWHRFLQLFFITLGIGFTVAGILFFFAYNWADMHKFAKFGLMQGLILATTGLVLFPKINQKVRDVVLTGASVLVGVLFAVFGQVYQTGANAYDFFFGWTVFVTLWALVSNFAPLWLLYLVLINTTFVLYAQQVASDWSDILVLTLLFALNTAAFFGFYLLSRHRKNGTVPNWFLNTIALAAVCFATAGIIFGIFEEVKPIFLFLVFATLGTYTLAIWHGLKEKRLFFLAIVAISLIVIIASLIGRYSQGEAWVFLLNSLFVVASITLVIKYLIDLQKKWKNEP